MTDDLHDRDLELEGLRFRPRPMVEWLSPPRLLQSGAEVVVSDLFGRFADKRELQTWEQGTGDPAYSSRDEIWIDYAADVGDGFDSTSSIAWALAKETLEVDGKRLPRGSVLILGGDEVYPAASRQGYEDRFIGPYTAALPESHPPEAAPHLWAVPGNHDWYDGLTSFLRLFCQGRWIGGWKTQQRRSYFALRLPRPWWLWATDIQLDTELDDLQIAYFRNIATHEMSPGDRLILCTAKPSWIKSEYEPESYRNLAFVEHQLVPEHVDLVATLTGDLHHYSRYQLTSSAQAGSESGRFGSIPAQRITAGGGGAYLSATHTLPHQISLPRLPWAPEALQVEDAYERKEIYPDAPTSRKKSWGAILAPTKTMSFVLFLAAIYALWVASMVAAIDAREGLLAAQVTGDRWLDLLADSIGGASVVATALLLVTLAAFADFRNWLAKLAVAIPHAALHLGAAVSGLWLITRAFDGGAPDVAVWGAALGAGALTGALAGTVIFGTYIFAMHRLFGERVPNHTNEAFAGQGIADYKCFLRLHIRRDGPLTIYPIKLETACRNWQYVHPPGGKPTIVPNPGEEPKPGLIEEPIPLDMQPWPPEYDPSAVALHVRNEGVLDAPIDNVWAWLVRPDRWHEYYPNARRVRIVAGPSPELSTGTIFKWVTFRMRLTSTVTACEPRRHVAWRFRAFGIRGYHRWQLDPANRGCRVVTEETQRGWVPRLFSRLLRPEMLRQHELWLVGLERSARRGPPSP